MDEQNFIPFVQSTENKNDVTKTLFLNVMRYMVFCYHKMIADKVKYSQNECEETTKLKFEDYLKFQFIDNYLNKQLNKRNNKVYDIYTITFEAETEKLYKLNNITQADKIDIFVGNLNLNIFDDSINLNDIYFAFECKRLENNAKNAQYIKDIEKFTQREYAFRLPYNGMIAFVEKCSSSLDSIILDIENKLQKHKTIKTVPQNNTYLQNIDIKEFNLARYSIHSHSTLPHKIEIGHLFFDYSDIVIKN